jgi:transcriptional regulator with XRE-family HTH domain
VIAARFRRSPCSARSRLLLVTGRAGQAISGQARELGNELRRIRERAELTVREVARVLHADKSKVSRIENGLRLPSELDVAMYVALCHATEAERDRLLELTKQSGEGNWLRPHGEALPEQLRSLIFQENTAQTITSYEPLIIPGLLQTEDYARYMCTWAGLISTERIGLQVEARLGRQRLLDRHSPPSLTFFLHEHVLRTPVGSAALMHEQLLHLLLRSSSTSCVIRLVRHTAGPANLLGGSFVFMEYAEHTPVVYAETQTASVFTEKEVDVGIYRRILTKLDGLALDAEQSRRWVAHLATQYDRAKDQYPNGRANLA